MKKRGLAKLQAKHEMGKIRQLQLLFYLQLVIVLELLAFIAAVVFL